MVYLSLVEISEKYATTVYKLLYTIISLRHKIDKMCFLKVPPNPALDEAADGLIKAWELYGSTRLQQLVIARLLVCLFSKQLTCSLSVLVLSSCS